ncbi:GTP 3',8-cyclase MoaA [Allosphingosinicella deserti]|uniref:GTP 3',8-cyclase n=1 Tax=Allosphingosinicella deserti TaxID=2116704 RepID=A0A2P7QHB6_9SPHN|nr:GTP 3',8-cyclase MoaA [Sphingomonas deserti]PSJ37362.1 GTP 3',8-cyclase MoaA [Sphingomonas deserti]
MTRPLIDSFGRRIEYVRLSVTDRCDLRCRYCMSEQMQFLPSNALMTFAEIEQLADALIDRGVRRIRLTGGEPLVRRGIIDLVRTLGARIGSGLEELTMTTNGTQLPQLAPALFEAGIRRINVSLDSLDPERFRFITRRGDLSRVLAGIAAAKAAGMAIKINMVALAGLNEDEIGAMLRWCSDEGFDLSLIETMPLGAIEEDRTDRYLPLDAVKRRLEECWTLLPSTHRTGGPARYYQVEGTRTRLGLITPLTGNFCAGCNRIRVTATGTVYGCLGREQKVELRDALRSGGRMALDALLDELIAGKPLGHDFKIGRADPAVARHMSVTGG